MAKIQMGENKRIFLKKKALQALSPPPALWERAVELMDSIRADIKAELIPTDEELVVLEKFQQMVITDWITLQAVTEIDSFATHTHIPLAATPMAQASNAVEEKWYISGQGYPNLGLIGGYYQRLDVRQCPDPSIVKKIEDLTAVYFEIRDHFIEKIKAYDWLITNALYFHDVTNIWTVASQWTDEVKRHTLLGSSPTAYGIEQRMQDLFKGVTV